MLRNIRFCAVWPKFIQMRSVLGAIRRNLVDRTTWTPAISLVAVWFVTATLSFFYPADSPQQNEEEGPGFSEHTRSDGGHTSESVGSAWLASGHTSSLSLGGSIKASVTGPFDRDPQKLHFAFDWTADSVIESNDGKRIVELRTFKHVSEAFLLGDYDRSLVPLEVNAPRFSSAHNAKNQHVGMRRVPAAWLSDTLVARDPTLKPSTLRGFWDVGPLSGKSIRLTHRLGAGVESIQPFNCRISPLENLWLRGATLDWHWGLPSDGLSAQPNITPHAALDEVMPTTMRMRPPWSELSISDQAALSDSAAEHCTVKLSWKNGGEAFKRWFPPGHLLFADYSLHGDASISLRIQRSLSESDSDLHLSGTPGSEVSVSGLMSASPPLIADQSSILPPYLQRHCYLLTFEGSDLGVALFFLLAVSTLAFTGGAKILSWKSRHSLLALTASGLLLVYVIFLHGQASLSSILPCSSAIVVTNCLPLSAAMLAGLLYGADQIPKWRREIFASGLLGIGWYAVLCTISPVAAQSTNQYANGVCLQTSRATCSAAAAVSLLNLYNIRGDESELARLCLTSNRGTNMLGIYRGLTLKTTGTPYHVVHVQCEFEQLFNPISWPMLIPVKQQVLAPLTYRAADRKSVLDFAWWKKSAFLKSILTADHCVVLYGVTEQGDAIIGDPSNSMFGRVRWSKEQLEKSWLGEGFRLEVTND